MEKEVYKIWKQELLDAGGENLLVWGQKEPFEAPATYFQTLASEIKDRIEDEAAAGSLFMMTPPKELFSAPEGYFDSFPARLNAAIAKENASKTKIRSLRPGWRLASVAAAILIFIMGTWLVFSPGLSSAVPQFSEAEIMEFMETENIDTYTLAEIFDISDISIQEASKLTEDDIEDFLNEGDISEWDLEEILQDEI